MSYKYITTVILTIIYRIHGMEHIRNAFNNSDVTERVVGGELAEEVEFPFMVKIPLKMNLKSCKQGIIGHVNKNEQILLPQSVAIMIQVEGMYHFNCGGSLINANYVLTAAHCVKGFRTASFLLKLGTIKLSKKKSSTIRTVKKRWYHRLYNITTINYDVGLLKMSSQVTISNQIQTICLMTKPGLYSYGHMAWLIGWGSEKEGDNKESNVLKKTSLPIIDNRICQQWYKDHREITDQMLCAGNKNGESGMCNGDSGGPLVNRGYKPAQIGITSWSKGCARKRKFGVFTRIEEVAYWIRLITTFDECKLPNLPNYPIPIKEPEKTPVNNLARNLIKNPESKPAKNSVNTLQKRKTNKQ